jgi:flagellar hook-associated protein 1 FlgK
MTLFGSVNTALSGLQSMMTALQTTGHNLGNAATPGYSRQRTELSAARPQTLPRFQAGRGVGVAAVRRVIDQSLEGRLRDAASRLSELGVRSETLQRVEGLMGALSESDLGAAFDQLFSSISDFVNHPEDASTRRQVLGNADTLARSFNELDRSLREFRQQLNGEVEIAVSDVNAKASEIAALNVQIVGAEKSGLAFETANDLRDRRDLLMRELSDLLQVSGVETAEGSLNVMVGTTFLVFGAESYEVGVEETAEDGTLLLNPVFAGISAALSIGGGRLQGLLESRDGLLADAARDLDLLANATAFEFNRVQSTGQGLQRFQDHTGLRSMPDPGVAIAIDGSVTARSTRDTLIDASLIGMATDPTGRTVRFLDGANALQSRRIIAFDAGSGTIFLDRPLGGELAIDTKYQIGELPFAVRNGSFKVVMTNETTGVQEEFSIDVDLDRIGADTTWSDIVADLDAIPNLDASLTSDNRIRIRSAAGDLRFAFAGDTSGFLAAAGLNAFFEGDEAGGIAVQEDLLDRPDFLSGAFSNQPGDNGGALAFLALRDVAAVDGRTMEEFYQGLVGELAVRTREAQDREENQALVAQQLENQRERVSGVNIDEEAVAMIQFQRSFQASARFIGVIDELLDTLVNGI